MVGARSSGILRRFNGRLYIDDVPLFDATSNFDGKFVSWQIQEADGSAYTIDEKIQPLVTALQDAGYITVSSCHGHFDREYPYPYVTLINSGFLPVMPGWFGQDLGHGLTRIRPLKPAETQDELESLQSAAATLAAKLAM